MGQFNKKEFSEIIRKLRSYMDIEDKVNKIFRENNNETYLSFTDAIVPALSILSKMYDDTGEWIDYYAWEIDFGRKWTPGMIKDQNGEDIPLQTAEDLYDLITDRSR